MGHFAKYTRFSFLLEWKFGFLTLLFDEKAHEKDSE